MKKEKFEKIIFWVLLSGFCFIILISLVYGFVNKEEPSEFFFDNCIEKYIFVYEDLCDNESFYVAYPENEIIKGELPILTVNEYPYFIYWKRCVQYYEIGCGEHHGKI